MTRKITVPDLALFALAASLVAGVAVQAVHERFTAPDYFVHLGAVREFADGLGHVRNPMVSGSVDDPYLSPYTAGIGLLAGAIGADAHDLLRIVGVLNVAGLVLALVFFARSLTDRRWAPPLLVLFTLVAWGIQPWRWSGFFSLNSIGAAAPYSSTAASALGLVVLAVLLRARRRGAGPGGLVVIAGSVPLIVVSHPFTALWLGLFAAGIVIGDPPNRLRLVGHWWALRPIVAAALGLGLAVLWPYYDVRDLLGGSGTFAERNDAMFTWVGPRLFLAVPGAIIMVDRIRRRTRDPLRWSFAILLGVYVVALAVQAPILGRTLPGLVLVCHAAMATWAGERLAMGDLRDRRRATAAVAAIVAVGLVGSSAGVARMVPEALAPASVDRRLPSLTDPYEGLRGLIEPETTLVSTRGLAIGAAAFSGRSLAPTAPAPFVEEIPRRRAVAEDLLQPGRTGERWLDVRAELSVEWFLVEDLSRARRFVAALGDLGVTGVEIIEVGEGVVAVHVPFPDGDRHRDGPS